MRAVYASVALETANSLPPAARFSNRRFGGESSKCRVTGSWLGIGFG